MSERIRTAVILAAGRGTRLAAEWRDRPKGFLTLGAEPIVVESIRRLVAHGIREVVIVTGHAAADYEALAQQWPGRIRTVHNERYAGSGSMVSLDCAAALTSGPFLLLESDLVYEPRALALLLANPAPDAVLLSGPTAAGDEVFVTTRDGLLVNMAKDPARLAGPVTGELVGISKISAPLFARLRALAAAAFARSLLYDYETDCLVAAARDWPIHCPLVPDLLWGEIDDAQHLRRARESLYPAIAALDRALPSDAPSG